MINGSRIRRRQVQVAGRKWINFATKKKSFSRNGNASRQSKTSATLQCCPKI